MIWIWLGLICAGIFFAGFVVGWLMAVGGVRRRRRVETIDLSSRRW